MLSNKSKKWLVIILGSLTWSLTMVKSGWQYKYGLGFWGPNGHDGIWHISLIESMSRGSFQMPIFAGEMIKNYHVGFDLTLAVIHRLTGIPASVLYFQIAPPIMAVLIGYLVYKFVTNWTKSNTAALGAVFFTYFGGNLGWLLGKGESVFWSQQAISTLVNPPYALSLIIVLLGLIFLQKKNWLVAGVLFGLTFQIKIYAGILIVGGLFVAAIWRRQRYLVLTWIISGVVGAGLLLLTTAMGGNLLVWQPGWFLETMMGLSDRLNWPRFYSAMTNYRLGHNWPKAISAYLVAFIIFWVGNMGTRLIKEWSVLGWIKRRRDLGWEEAVFAAIIIAGGLIPMFFLQSGTPWNTIQFFYYSLFFSGILAGIALSKVKSRAVIFVLVALTLPTTWQSLKHYLPSRPPAKLSIEEIDALRVLSTQPMGVVLTYPYNSQEAKMAETNPPRPLYLYDSTAYVAAFSHHPVYLEDEVNLNITGFDWKSRRAKSEQFFTTTDGNLAKDFLQENNITYLYLANIDKDRPLLSDTQVGMYNIFENSQVAIWKVK